ncbi:MULTISPECIES: cytidylyltransferase domain-containing protein [unclassified Salinivibrio]|uniref:acylneuraminate cytidylyltransferase family protein n=1 Tax=unclassified Salinivibrio TaxID=2636825 RepID=UPI00128DDE65|nr:MULTISPECIES: acylneuraminate cytidylyltransferase family protein [unclassified Salinivibrio]MPS31267.1 acylneuraminate cytidylyltransferase family protein [Salinivibrio sp. VYel7]MPX92667.1 acylneuraminate cytidylyltransferase family protein [Salinivibrio sp. VYel9]MPX95649.1 acylneuraminate cytidylyltransferase family protein [Salinivibrio sp. VYel6]MPY01272.1 acylneuraminate cytidylyltransferase family protein [Salinivibrio sp. VYel4]MPY02409.1 acylneuraminate cytidylyltransferase family
MPKKAIALIPARGGSKGLARKNVLPVNGKPLIAWTIEAALHSEHLDEVYVSTEDEEIARVSEAFGAQVIPRPAELASDQASSIDVITHALSWLEQHAVDCDVMALLQPTSPLRKAQCIDNALALYRDKDADFVISVFEPQHTPVKAYIAQHDGSISGLFSDDAPYQRRQDLPRAFQPNGAIYIFSAAEFKRHNYFPRSKVFPYVMSEYLSADIDTKQDLDVVEQRMKELKNDSTCI